MADEFGDEISIYVWPRDHKDGTPYPDDFMEHLRDALRSAGIDWELT